jgi:AcrR family transcriptional regulator
VLDAAVAVVDARGPDGLTLAAVAERVGIRTPSLYAHVDGLAGLKLELRLRGVDRLGAELQRAAVGRSGRDAVHAIARAYRDFARAHPGLYGLTQVGDGDERVARASAAVVGTVVAVLAGYGLAGTDAIHATRVLRSSLHGFVSLEAGGGFALALDLNETFDVLLDALDAGLERLAAGGADARADAGSEGGTDAGGSR